jgi:hypothetical protein
MAYEAVASGRQRKQSAFAVHTTWGGAGVPRAATIPMYARSGAGAGARARARGRGRGRIGAAGATGRGVRRVRFDAAEDQHDGVGAAPEIEADYPAGPPPSPASPPATGPLPGPPPAPLPGPPPAPPEDPNQGWTPQVVRRVQAYGTLAQLSSAMNERAALSYSRLDKVVLVLMGLLALVASGQGTTSLVAAHDTSTDPVVTDSALRVVSSLCSILGAFLAMVVSRLDWASRAKALATRATRYAKMATDINTQLTVAVGLRTNALMFLTEISRLNEELQALTDPLPLRYRRTAVIDSIMSMWGGGPAGTSRREGDGGVPLAGPGGGLPVFTAGPPPLLAATEGDTGVVMQGLPPVVVTVAPAAEDNWGQTRADVLALFGAVPDEARH